jgi:integrase
MAFVRARGKKWIAEIVRAGHPRQAKTFKTRKAAKDWSTTREAELMARKTGEIPPHSVAAALDRYAKEISPKKGGSRWEAVRLAKFKRTLGFEMRLLTEVSTADIAQWRDKALAGTLPPAEGKEAKALASGSVRREMVLLRSVFEMARKEWGWLEVNPMQDIGYPPNGRPRKRRIAQAEIDAMAIALGLPPDTVARRPSQRVAVAFLWAVETAMRAGEIVGLTPDAVSLEGRFARLPKTKNGDEREVPLSKAAIALLDRLEPTGRTVFGVSSKSLDALFRKARKKAGLSGFTFHDSRAEALTRMSRKVDLITLARIAGHRDLKSLSVYYRESASDIAARLD